MTARVCAALPLRLGLVVTIVMCAPLWITAAAAGTLTVTWDANAEPNLAGYKLSIGVAPGQYTNTIDVGKQTTYLFSEPDPTVKYYFAVRAYNTSGQFSSYSVEAQSTPTSATQTQTGSSQPPASAALTLTWDANTEPNLAGYKLSIGVAPGQYTNTIDVGKQTSYVFTEPDPTLTYYFAVRAYNTSGQMSPYSLEVNSAPAPLPTVTTGAAASITANGAVLNGTANPMGLTSTGYFQYGATSGYGASTPTVSLGSGTQAVSIANGTLSNLACNSTYHFRAVALNASGTAFGNDGTLTTSACALPTVTTGGAISISATGATLTSTVTPNGSSATAAFQYGLTTAYGAVTAGSPVSSSMASVAIAAGGLTCGKLYHFRGVATNGTGSAYGADATFTTLACSSSPVPPTVTTGGANSVSATGATLTSTVTPNSSSATAAFQYGLTSAYGSTTAGSAVGSSTTSVAIAASGLSCGTLYHFRGMATNGSGSGYGADATFTTLACSSSSLIPPTITGPPPSGTINAGQTVTLNVWATGSAPLMYQWYRGASGVTTNPIAGATSLSYTPPPLNATSTFWVRVSNGAGSANSPTVTITVLGGKKKPGKG